MSDPVRIFVGCAVEHWLAFQVLKSSILRRTTRPCEIYPLNNADATRPADHWPQDPLYGKYKPIHIPTPTNPKQRAATTFSFQRFLIPELVGFQGEAIYLDSDQVVLADIAEFWDQPITPPGYYLDNADGSPVLASVLKPDGWQSAVMKIDCAVGAWRIAKLVRQLDQGKRTYGKLLNLVNMGIQNETLDPAWNTMDRYVQNPGEQESWNAAASAAKLLHFTDMATQPWLRVRHPWGAIWANELHLAIMAGHLTTEDVLASVEQGDVRPSLALLVGGKPPRPDHTFVYPDARAKGQGLHR
jgi:hypothetical protein